jgi:biopolymer transport protein ExbB/TolQ
MNSIFMHMALLGDTWVLVLLILASILSVGVMVERALAFGRNKGDFSALMDGLAASLEKGDVESAMNLARDSQRLEGRVALAGLRNFPKGAASVEEVMSSRWLDEKQRLEKYLIILGTLGNNAPFIGLFGTVLGVIKAFNDLGVTGQSGVSVVMAGISVALVATAFGILVAIPAVVANNYFVTRVREWQTNTDILCRIIMAYLKETREAREEYATQLH